MGTAYGGANRLDLSESTSPSRRAAVAQGVGQDSRCHLLSSIPYLDWPTLPFDAFDAAVRSPLKAPTNPTNSRSERCAPYFFIIGTFKAGTTSLYQYLASHDGVRVLSQEEITRASGSDVPMSPVKVKEPGFFGSLGHATRNHAPAQDFLPHQLASPPSAPLSSAGLLGSRAGCDGEDGAWKNCMTLLKYATSYFPRIEAGQPAVTGEATPSYIWDPLAPARLSRWLPNSRHVLLLRDPTRRAYSRIRHQVELFCASHPGKRISRFCPWVDALHGGHAAQQTTQRNPPIHRADTRQPVATPNGSGLQGPMLLFHIVIQMQLPLVEECVARYDAARQRLTEPRPFPKSDANLERLRGEGDMDKDHTSSRGQGDMGNDHTSSTDWDQWIQHNEQYQAFVLCTRRAARMGGYETNAILDQALAKWKQQTMQHSSQTGPDTSKSANDALTLASGDVLLLRRCLAVNTLAHGLYLWQIENWLRHSEPEQLLIIRSEDLFADARSSLQRVEQHLGLQPKDWPDALLNTKFNVAVPDRTHAGSNETTLKGADNDKRRQAGKDDNLEEEAWRFQRASLLPSSARENTLHDLPESLTSHLAALYRPFNRQLADFLIKNEPTVGQWTTGWRDKQQLW